MNGQTGVVVLDAGDVGADPAGTAAGLVDDLSGVTNASAAARTNLGLGNVDNTSDANKPVSTAQQTALDGKAAASHPTPVRTSRRGPSPRPAWHRCSERHDVPAGRSTWAAVTPGASAIND